MLSQDYKKIALNIAEKPGVYFFIQKKQGKEVILYIGKATNLRDRVSSYFSKDLIYSRGPKIIKMIEEANSVRFQETDSSLEALLLENYLIKKHQPLYNTKEKDDKSYQFVVITKEDFPKVLLVRGRDILVSGLKGQKLPFDVKESFGPFPSGSAIRESLKIIRKIFPFSDKCKYMQYKDKGCFNYQIGLCPGICSGKISKKEYAKNIKNITLFFEGRKKDVLKNLEKDMKISAKVLDFEKASEIKKQIFAINHIQDISLIKKSGDGDVSGNDFSIESYDIAHISGDFVVGVLVKISGGILDKSGYRKFKIKSNPNADDLKSLEEVLKRRLSHKDWQLPDLFVVDGGENQRKLFQRILKEEGIDREVVSVLKDKNHNPKEILGDSKFLEYKDDILLSNSEAHRFAINFHRKIRSKIV